MELAFWRNIAIVWLSLFCFVGLIIPLVIGYFAVRGLAVVPGKVRPLLRKAQGYSQIMQQQSEKASQRVAAPVIQLHVQATKLQTIVTKLRPVQKQQISRKISP